MKENITRLADRYCSSHGGVASLKADGCDEQPFGSSTRFCSIPVELVCKKH